MKHWPVAERPREKLLCKGPSVLTDAELLAIVIGTGSKDNDALSIAHRLINNFNSVRGIVSAHLHEFIGVDGVGVAKFATLQASQELMRRSLAEPLIRGHTFKNVEDVSTYLRATMRDYQNEVFGMLVLDSQHQLIGFREMFFGTINSAAIYPRELVKQALFDNAAAVVLVHNHPSGIAEPSHADIQITNEIVKAMSLMDIDVLDHFVVGDTSAVSFAQRGLL